MWTAQPGMASYAKRRNRVLVDWDLPYFNLTGHDLYTWYQIYYWSFDGQPAISTLDVDEREYVHFAAEDARWELPAAKDGGAVVKFRRPEPSFGSFMKMFEKMFSGKADYLAELQHADLRDIRGKGIAKDIEQQRPPNWDPAYADVDCENQELHRAWLYGILSVPCPVMTLSCKPDGGMTHICLPFIEPGVNLRCDLIEKMIEVLIRIILKKKIQ